MVFFADGFTDGGSFCHGSNMATKIWRQSVVAYRSYPLGNASWRKMPWSHVHIVWGSFWGIATLHKPFAVGRYASLSKTHCWCYGWGGGRNFVTHQKKTSHCYHLNSYDYNLDHEVGVVLQDNLEDLRRRWRITPAPARSTPLQKLPQ